MNLNFKMVSFVASALLVASMSGCGDGSSTSATPATGASGANASGETQIVINPIGSVTGLVQDTNGNPIENVKVYLAGQNTITDAGGIYHFDKVAATGVADLKNQSNNVLSITIAAPTGYIGATVTVKPQAQISAITTSQTFIDGFLAQAGTAVLPQINSTVTGVLRDTNTGEPLADQVMNFEFTAGGTGALTAQEQAQDGVSTTYAVPHYTIKTDANGRFKFDSLPSDSNFTILVPGYNVSANADVSTDGETSVAQGNVTATKIYALDTLSPYVVSVNGVVSNGARGVLNDDTRNTFVVNFSETLTASALELAGNSILLYAGEQDKETSLPFTATIDTTNKAVTIITSATLNDGDYVDIYFLNADTVDTSLNSLTSTGTAIAYDSNKANYTKLQLEIFTETNTNAPAVTAEAQMSKDVTGEDDNKAIQLSSDSFNDVLDETAGFQQLNVPEAGPRLNELAMELGATGVTVDKTRVTFTPQGAPQYFVYVSDKDGNDKSPATVGGVALATSTNIEIINDFGVLSAGTLEIKVSDVNPVEIYLTNVEPTDKVTIIPVDDLGYAGTASVITLVDNVSPTTVLQTSYYDANKTSGDNASGAVVKFGDGGELADASGALTVGTPYLAINNSLLDNLDAAGENVSTGINPDLSLKKELFESGVVDIENTGLIYLNGASAYDAQAIATFNTDAKLARKMGVAFSENIASAGTPFVNSTTGISNFAIQNNVETTVNGIVRKSDLITMDVANVMTLANANNLEVIDYTGITDEANNAATSATNAKVVIKDEMAPMVLSAAYSSSSATMVITFNEAISLTDSAVAPAVNSVVEINGATATYDATATENVWVLSASNTVLTIPASAFTSSINIATFWSTAGFSYAYPDNNYGEGSSTDLNHQLMDFSAISDVHGNSWDSYATRTEDLSEVANPEFATAFKTSIFGANAPAFTATTTTSSTQTIEWTFSHPVRISEASDIFNVANGTTMNGSNEYSITDIVKIAEAFIAVQTPDAAGAGTEDALISNSSDASSLILSTDRKTITLRFRTATLNLTSATGDIVRLNAKIIVSEGDTAQDLAINGLRATAAN